MSGSTTDIDQILVSQSQKEVTANALFDAASPSMLFGRRAETTTGLTWGYFGGTFNASGTPTHINNGTVALTLSATNYVQASGTTGLVSVNTTGFSVGAIQLYQIVVNGVGVTSYLDRRCSSTVSGQAVNSVIPIGYSQSSKNYAAILVIDCSSASTFDVTLTGNIQIGFNNPAYDGQKITLRIKQDAIGSRMVAFNASVQLGTDITGFTATTTINKKDVLGFIYDLQADKFIFVAVVKGY